MVTMQTADNALKSYYLGAIADQLNTAVNPFLAQIKQSTNDVYGKDVKKLVRYGLNGGVGAGSETGNLPVAGGNKYVTFTSPLKNLYGSIEISDKALRTSQNNEGAFVNLLNDEMEGLVKSASFNFGRMLFGNGTGKLTLITYDDKFDPIVEDTRNVFEGMVVDIVGGNGVASFKGLTITGVDRKTKKIYFDKFDPEEDEYPDNSVLVLHDSLNMELTGLEAIFSETATTLYGVNKKENEWMKPVVEKNVGAITENKIQKVIDTIEENTGAKTNFIICSWGVKRALLEYYNTYKRMVDTMEIKGGHKALSFNGIPVIADRFCPAGTMYLLNTDDFSLNQLCDWQWLEGEDGKILKQIAGKPVYTATLVKYAELMCCRPAAQAKLSGITEA